MRLPLLALVATCLASYVAARAVPGADTALADRARVHVQRDTLPRRWHTHIKPKVFILSMFAPEDVWTARLALSRNITLPGLSPLFPDVHCNAAGEICHAVTGEGEINAASTISALVLSDAFDLRESYFLVAGIAGVNPHVGTTGSAGLARYAVQVALAYEIDARQIPANWSTGYWLQGTSRPGEIAGAAVYGTELFELNTNLRDRAMALITSANITLNDTAEAQAYRATYDYAPANQPPTVFYGDVATSDVYFAGSLLADAFANITKLWTNGTGQYALTAQEDNASFEAMVRAHKAHLLDFSRVILLRTASDFDRAPPGVDEVSAFESTAQGGFEPAIANLFVVGNPIVQGIIAQWDEYRKGVEPQEGWAARADLLHTLAMPPALRRRGQRWMRRT